jgi:cobalt/nickel transport protein
MDKLQKKIVIALLILLVLTPTGIFLPVLFNTGNAWGEWSAETLKELIGYVPQGLAKYAGSQKAPLAGYTLNGNDSSLIHQSGYYIVCCIIGAMTTMIVTLILSKMIVRNGK